MKISSIINYSNSNNKSQNFRGYSANVYKDGSLAYKTLSCFYRADLHWVKFVNYIIDKYKGVDKVNILNHACSAGYEPYSMLMLLMKNLGKNSKKYLPIIARDIDSDMINLAKHCNLPVDSLELSVLKNKSGNVFDDNFEVKKIENAKIRVLDNKYIVSCKTDLKDNIKFCQSDVFKDKALINKENTILLFRNVWMYLGAKNISELADFLATNMKKSSILVIGDFDIANHIDEILVDRGFKGNVCKGNENYVFEAPGG